MMSRSLLLSLNPIRRYSSTTSVTAPFGVRAQSPFSLHRFRQGQRRTMTKASPEETIAEFKKCVNMTTEELQVFLETDDSNRVGWKEDGGESVGHQSGRRIVDLLQKGDSEYDEDDISHMRKVVSYVHRHRAQGPSKHDVEHSKWRYSLMNWGNDPLKE